MDLFENLPLAMAGREEPVHQIRVAARRIRVVLPLAAVKPNGRRVRRAVSGLKALTRTAGASRDLDVALGLLPRAVSLGPGTGSAARSVLARRLRDARRRARRRMTEGLLDFDIAGLRKDLRRIGGHGGEDRFTALMRVRLARETEGTALLAEMGAVGDAFDPKALHEVRTRVRRLRYAAEFGAALAGAPPEAAKRFRETQELLGEMHDAWILAQWLGRQSALALERGRDEEAEEAARLEAASEDLSRALHGKYLESAPAERVRRALTLVGRNLSVA
jgi:CHAD domain-containing protein